MAGMCLSLVMCCWLSNSAEAIWGVGDIVHDPQNFQVNLLTQANTLKSTLNEAILIQNQAKSLQYQLQGLWNDGQNLQQNPLKLLAQIQGMWNRYQGLLNTAEGLTYQMDASRARFEAAYPQLPRSNLNIITAESAAMLQSIRAASQTAVQTQSVYDRMEQQMQTNQQALNGAQMSVGALQVGQAQAQLTALTNEQLASIAAIEAAGNRVNTEFISMQVKERQDGAALNSKFMEGYGGQGFKKVGQSSGVPLP